MNITEILQFLICYTTYLFFLVLFLFFFRNVLLRKRELKVKNQINPRERER